MEFPPNDQLVITGDLYMPYLDKALFIGSSGKEVSHNGVRYILRRNPWRAQEIADNRESKFEALARLLQDRNRYLADHPRAKVAVAIHKVQQKAAALKIGSWVKIEHQGRLLTLAKDALRLEEDGCYAIKSDVEKAKATAQQIHDRYRDLEKVERAFRTMKTFHLELRPVYVQTKESTRGHVVLVMLALIIQRELEKMWRQIDAIHFQTVSLGGAAFQTVPEPRKLGKRLLKAADIKLPTVFPKVEANVHTKKKLNKIRK